MLWGFSISSIGMSLAFSLFLGVITSIDTILPLILVPEGRESVIGTDVGNMMLFGIFIIQLFVSSKIVNRSHKNIFFHFFYFINDLF